MNTPTPRTTAKQILDLLCRQGVTGVSANDIMKIVEPIEDRAKRFEDALRIIECTCDKPSPIWDTANNALTLKAADMGSKLVELEKAERLAHYEREDAKQSLEVCKARIAEQDAELQRLRAVIKSDQSSVLVIAESWKKCEAQRDALIAAGDAVMANVFDTKAFDAWTAAKRGAQSVDNK